MIVHLGTWSEQKEIFLGHPHPHPQLKNYVFGVYKQKRCDVWASEFLFAIFAL